MLSIINTWKCNFQCAHCLYSCSSKRTGYVSKYDITQFVKLFGSYDLEVNLVGGEPFLHPHIYWQIEYLSWIFCNVRIATNGSWLMINSKVNKFENFMSSIDSSKITIMISHDIYHDAMYNGYSYEQISRILHNIDSYFNIENDKRMNRNNQFILLGRAKKNQIGDYDKDRTCKEDGIHGISLLPDGSISLCCNARMIIGSVRNSYDELKSIANKTVNYVIRKNLKCSECPRRSPFSQNQNLRALSYSEL